MESAEKVCEEEKILHHQCKQCKINFSSISELKEHNIVKHSDKPSKVSRKCGKYDANYTTKEESREHYGTAHVILVLANENMAVPIV